MSSPDPDDWCDDDDPMPETIETNADHGIDLVVDDATGVIGRLER